MRTITLIVVHYSVDRQGNTLWIMGISHLHRSLGWKGCGYHFAIPTGDTVKIGKPPEQADTHCKNHSRHGIGVYYIGGLANDGKAPMDIRMEAQREALQGLFCGLRQRLPKAPIVGHQGLDPSKSCLCFNVVNESSDWFNAGSPFASLERHVQ